MLPTWIWRDLGTWPIFSEYSKGLRAFLMTFEKPKSAKTNMYWWAYSLRITSIFWPKLCKVNTRGTQSLKDRICYLDGTNFHQKNHGIHSLKAMDLFPKHALRSYFWTSSNNFWKYCYIKEFLEETDSRYLF